MNDIDWDTIEKKVKEIQVQKEDFRNFGKDKDFISVNLIVFFGIIKKNQGDIEIN